MKRCGRCRQARYCGTDCQRADWPNHKPYCRPWDQVVDDMADGKEKDVFKHTKIRDALMHGRHYLRSDLIKIQCPKCLCGQEMNPKGSNSNNPNRTSKAMFEAHKGSCKAFHTAAVTMQRTIESTMESFMETQ